MGNDGGSIPDRRDLVRNKPKAEQADKANQTRARWFFCALSKRKLQEPVVSCALGKLYNKDSIIEYLLDKSAYGDGETICGHIRSLKDVKTLTLTPNPAPEKPAASESTVERAQFVCPLTLKEMNGAQPFVYILSCGCVFSQAGLRTVASPVSSSSSPPSSPEDSSEDKDKAKEKDPAEKAEQLNLCPQCATKYAQRDILLLNPGSEDEEKMYIEMALRRAQEKPRKSKKRKTTGPDDEDAPPAKSQKVSSGTSTPKPSIHPSVGAMSRAVASSLAMEEAKRKASMSDAVKSLYGNGTQRKETFMTRGTFTRYA